MKKYLLFVIILVLFGCNKKENCFKISDDYLERVNNENVQEILKGYLKENYNNFVADTIYQIQGDKPSIFLINRNENEELEFSSLASDGKYWCPNFSKKLNAELSPYFDVSTRNFSTVSGDIDNEIIGLKYSGCFPHNCPNRAFLFYSLKIKDGFINVFSDDSKINKYPLGLPVDKNTLFEFEKLIISEISNDDELQNLLQLPWERKIPPFYDKKEFPETSMISMIFDRIGKKININEYNVGYNYFMFDYDHDQILDVLFRLTQKNDNFEYDYSKMKNGYYLYSGKNNTLKYIDFKYNKDDLESLDNLEFPSDEIIFTELNHEKFLIITTQIMGNYNGADMKALNFFKIINNNFIVIENEDEIKQYKNELARKFQLNKNFYFLEN